jgi:hypothetical protein
MNTNETFVEPNGFLFFQCPSSKTFGFVSKEFWEKHKHLNDQDGLRTLEAAGLDMSGFCESMESFLEHGRSYKKGLKRLLELGFTEIENPWPED